MVKKPLSTLLLVLLPILFFSLHYYVHQSDKVFESWFILVSQDPEPMNIKKLALTKKLYPDYFHPFQKLEYHYAEKGKNETVLIEQGSMFKVDMDVIYGDPAKYYDPNVDGIHYKGYGVGDYPNGLFFIVQDLIIVAFVLLTVNKIRQFKNSKAHRITTQTH